MRREGLKDGRWRSVETRYFWDTKSQRSITCLCEMIYYSVQGVTKKRHLYLFVTSYDRRGKSESRRHLRRQSEYRQLCRPIEMQTRLLYLLCGPTEKSTTSTLCLKVPWLWWLGWSWFMNHKCDETISINMLPASWIEAVTIVNWLVTQNHR